MYGHKIIGLNSIRNRVMPQGYVGSGFVTKIFSAKCLQNGPIFTVWAKRMI